MYLACFKRKPYIRLLFVFYAFFQQTSRISEQGKLRERKSMIQGPSFLNYSHIKLKDKGQYFTVAFRITIVRHKETG